jgi:RNA polymerase sigma-70 factor, ECF subfamily
MAVMASADHAVDGTPIPPPQLDPESAEWIRTLTGVGPERDAALRRLHELLLRIARAELHRRGSRLPIAGPEVDDPWAYKFVIFEVSAKVGRHFWRNPGVPMEAEEWDRLPDQFGLGPAQESEWRDLVAALHRAVDRELTSRQRQVFVALVLNGVPLDAVAAKLGSTRGAIYKIMFDARRKLRIALVANGYLDDDLSRRS